MLKKVLLVNIILILGLFYLSANLTAQPLKVGFIYVSPIGNAGWTYQHELGRQAAIKSFGDKVETTYIENVPEGADSVRVLQNMASKGYNIIFATSFGYMNPVIQVARRYPNVVFEHATGYKKAKNVGNYLPRFYEGRYLGGIIAGKKLKPGGVVGYVGAVPIPEVIRGINAFTLGLRSVNPTATVRVIWTNSWYDPGKERETAETLISQGATLVTHHTDSTAVVQTANDRGIYAVAYHSDMSQYGPKAHLAAVIHKWDKFYISKIQQVMDGTWQSSSLWLGIKDGLVDVVGYNSEVPQSLRNEVAQKKNAIANGSLHPFAGPIKDQAGKVTIASGKTASDPDLLGMNYFVQGVIGQIPKN